jgi:hypothetical protein
VKIEPPKRRVHPIALPPGYTRARPIEWGRKGTGRQETKVQGKRRTGYANLKKER